MAKKRNKKIFIYVIGTVIFIASGFLYSCKSGNTDAYYVKQQQDITEQLSEPSMDNTDGDFSGTYSAITASSEPDKIFVYVCGNVMSAGVYEAVDGARVYELIEMAGGVTEKGCLEALNLAEHVHDGQKLYVPDYEEYENNKSFSYQADETNGSSLVNINNADLQQLMTLPGIGESRAQAIIDYRNDNGMFGCIEDIMSVSGIKESAFSKIKDYICVN